MGGLAACLSPDLLPELSLLLVVRLLVGQLGCPSGCHLSVGLPLCFPMKSICLCFQWSCRLPIPQATCSLSSQPLSVSLFILIAQAACPSVVQFPLAAGQSCLPICLPVPPPCESTPHFSPCVELGSLITKDHVSLPSPGLPPVKQSRRPASPGDPSSPPALQPWFIRPRPP